MQLAVLMEEATEQIDAVHRASTIPVEDGEPNRPTARHVSLGTPDACNPWR